MSDEVECLECGRYFMSVARHVQSHGMSADEYRDAHDLLRSDPLEAPSLQEKRRAIMMKLDRERPELLENLLQGGFKPGHTRPRADAKLMKRAGAHRTRQSEAEWAVRMAAVGWETWHDAREWAIENNQTWKGVAAHLGWSSVTPVQERAAAEGVELPARVTAKEWEMLRRARTWMEDHRTLFGSSDQVFSRWVAHERMLYEKGYQSRVHDLLDEIDPEWAQRPAERAKGPCEVEACERDAVSHTLSLCRLHYRSIFERPREYQGVPADGVELVACLECGFGFRKLQSHLNSVHQLSIRDYRAKHRTEDGGELAVVSEGFLRDQAAKTAAMWRERLTGAGWSSWADAAAWARENNCSWEQVAEKIDAPWTEVLKMARAEGLVAKGEKRIGARAEAMLEECRVHVRRGGTLADVPPRTPLVKWLSARMAAARSGKVSRINDVLDEIDPSWRAPVRARSPR